jgi:gliding motility-associated-like protein
MCDENSDGQEIFDLTENESFIANDEDMANLSFTYFLSQADANVPQNAIANPTAHQSGDDVIYIRVNKVPEVDFEGNNCYVIVAQELIVNPLPAINTPVTLDGCDADNNGTAIFDLQGDANELVVAGTPQVVEDFTFTYHATAADAASGNAPLPDMYESLPGTIYVRVVNNDTGCVNSAGVITLTVKAGATANGYDPDVDPSPMVQCADAASVNNNTSTFNLPTMDAHILGTQAPANYTVTYYATAADAAANTTIADPTAFVSPTGFVWATVTNNATGCRSIPVAIPLTVEPLPMTIITSSTGGNTICVEWGTDAFLSGLTLNSSINDTDDYTYQWYLDGVALPGEVLPSHTISTNLPGLYSVMVISTSPQLCGFIREFEVIRSGPAVVEAANSPGWVISNPFEDTQTLTMTVAGYGNYHYALDYGPFVDNGGVFTNVGPGKHFVTVRDMNNTSCGDIIIDDIEAINYPHFFTPNGDGINDTWNIFSLRGDATAKIYIFDRYGKLLKQISPQGLGWDGTFSGQNLPSDDYWFRVMFTDTDLTPKEFRAHFSMKR